MRSKRWSRQARTKVHRICVIGPPGSGKTTLAQELARRLGIRYIDFDATVLLPHWERVPREQRIALFEPLTRDRDWVTDGHLAQDASGSRCCWLARTR